jgi:hypothetical protein
MNRQNFINFFAQFSRLPFYAFFGESELIDAFFCVSTPDFVIAVALRLSINSTCAIKLFTTVINPHHNKLERFIKAGSLAFEWSPFLSLFFLFNSFLLSPSLPE